MVTYASVADPIVITGLGVVSPFGTTTAGFSEGLRSGRSAVSPLTQFDVTECASRCAASVQEFDPTRWISPLKIRRMDMTSQYAIAAASQALEDAALPFGGEPQDDVGVAIGTYTAGGSRTEEFLDGLFRLGPVGAPALLFNATVANVAASLIALELKFRGPNITISQKEVSGLTAFAHAVDLLQGGQARTIVAAGVDALYPLFFKVHDRFGVLSRNNGVPEGARPFDVSRNGFVLGEGAYAAILETASAATGRGAPVYAEVLALECGGTPAGINQWPREPDGIARVVRRAIERSGLTAADVDVVYASANSSGALDAVEASALARVFDGLRPAVTSVKGALGEASAQGPAAMTAAILCGRGGFVPPIAGLRTIDPACASLDLVTTERPARGPIVLINNVASGGALASAVLRVRDDARGSVLR